MGIDISEELIQVAKVLSKKKGLEDKVKFQIADAMDLPFSDNQFDIAIFQVMLVLVEDKVKTIREAYRVIKKGGRAGRLELSWRKEIDQDFLEKVSNVLCAYCMTNDSNYEGWKKTFEKAGIHNLVLKKGENMNGNYFDTLKDEGIINTAKIMFNSIKNREIRNRIKIMDKFFKDYSDYFGYGIYLFEKS